MMQSARLVILATLLAGLLAGCGSSRPGSPAVYAEIEATSDCAVLQATFDRSMDNAEARRTGDPLRDVSLSYADAAHARLEAVGCYG